MSKTQDIDNTMNEHRGLAASGASQYQQRAFSLKNCLSLTVIHAGKYLLNDSFAHGCEFYVKFCWFHGNILSYGSDHTSLYHVRRGV